jgi:hypothetical protein
MRLTIIPSDNVVVVGGRAIRVDCSNIDRNIHAVHWHDTEGVVEFNNDGEPVARGNGKLDSIAEFQSIVDAWHAAVALADGPPPPPPLPEARARVLAAVGRKFQMLAQAPIDYDVRGVTYTWDADNEAVRNISGVVLLFTVGVPVPDPRTWTPYQSLAPVSVSHADLIGLGRAIAARKDALFLKKKAKQAEIAALTDPAAVLAYDVETGW